VSATLTVAQPPAWSKKRGIAISADGVRGLIGLATLIAVWDIGAHTREWFGFVTPWLGTLPPPESVLSTWSALLLTSSYWTDLWLSFLRVISGFLVAMAIGIPFGLVLARSKIAYGIVFPSFEVIRPIPPIAWVPIAILFWPTQNLSIGFVIFLGAFFAVVINVLGGAKSIDIRFFQAAESMGASHFDMFRRIILPGVLPSVLVGAVVGMGISWEVVIAGELISGGGSAAGGSGGGIGFFIWNAYVTSGTSAESQIIVGMFSIGILGYLSCEIIRWCGRWLTPWLRPR
jgi:NitT/TauT family transport system permease protein